MTMRALLLLILSVGWWRIPRATRDNRAGVVAAGLIVVGVGIVLAVVASPLIEALETDAETLRVATGLVLVIAGAFRIFGVGTRAEDGSHRVSWLVPLAYPILIGPETVVVGLSVGADHGVLLVIAGSLAGVVLAVMATRVRHDAFVARLFVRAAGIATVVLAVTLIFDGLREV